MFRGALYAGAFFVLAKDKIAADGRTLAAEPALWPWIALYLCALTAGDWCATMAVSKSNSTVTSLVEISYPIWTALFAWMLLGRTGYDWRTVAGGGLVLAGVALVASSPASR